ncbi:MAG: hypothetical protein ACOZAL_01485 [Patescibacteria group bacterium]
MEKRPTFYTVLCTCCRWEKTIVASTVEEVVKFAEEAHKAYREKPIIYVRRHVPSLQIERTENPKITIAQRLKM